MNGGKGHYYVVKVTGEFGVLVQDLLFEWRELGVGVRAVVVVVLGVGVVGGG